MRPYHINNAHTESNYISVNFSDCRTPSTVLHHISRVKCSVPDTVLQFTKPCHVPVMDLLSLSTICAGAHRYILLKDSHVFMYYFYFLMFDVIGAFYIFSLYIGDLNTFRIHFRI